MTYFADDEQVEKPSIEVVIDVLKRQDDEIDETIAYGLSDLSTKDIEQIRPVWEVLDTTYRQILLQTLVDELQENYQWDYEAFCLMILSGTENTLKGSAIELLETSESFHVMRRLLEIAQSEVDVIIRAESVRVLGNFILMGELGNITEEQIRPVYEFVFMLQQDITQNSLVRARALESIAYYSDDRVESLIREAYFSEDDTLKISALIAMGHTADSDKWEETVLSELKNGTEDMQLEAVRACGELQIARSVRQLHRYFQDAEREGQAVAIWALGEIGTKEAIRVLEQIADIAEQEEDDEMLDLVEEAMGNATLGNFGT